MSTHGLKKERIVLHDLLLQDSDQDDDKIHKTNGLFKIISKTTET